MRKDVLHYRALNPVYLGPIQDLCNLPSLLLSWGYLFETITLYGRHAGKAWKGTANLGNLEHTHNSPPLSPWFFNHSCRLETPLQSLLSFNFQNPNTQATSQTNEINLWLLSPDNRISETFSRECEKCSQGSKRLRFEGEAKGYNDHVSRLCI